MNFTRGKQIVIHDPRLDDGQKPPRPLNPPQSSVLTWTVQRGDSLKSILKNAATLADAGGGKLDAVHIMAHGEKGKIYLGADGINWGNVEKFTILNGKTRNIVVFSCQVGSDETHDDALGSGGSTSSLGGAMASLSGAKVLVCRQNQTYSWGASRNIDFGLFEGEVYLYSPGGGHTVIFKNNTTGKAQIDLEPYIFQARA